MNMSGVQLCDGQSASNLFHRILSDTKEKFPDLSRYANLTANSRDFKKHYVELLPQYEAVRLSASDRGLIAQALSDALLSELVFHGDDESLPLREHLSKQAEPISLNQVSGTKAGTWDFHLTYDGHQFQSLQELADLLVKRHVMNGAAGEALTWLHRQVLIADGLNLNERRVVVFGAGAEMAATKLFLEAGANVLWLDVVAPPDDLSGGDFRGTLSWPVESLDLLVEPEKVLATILEFAADNPVDLCLYAYAPGQARELRLTGTMNAIVEALPQSLVGSVTMLVSPTTTSELGAEDLLDIERRRREAPLWERSLGATGVMGKPGIATCRYASVTRTLVNIQGTSYQAAQYLGKLMAAESWHTKGYRVSANTAAITQTRSLDHPVFDAAFGGAKALQVETFTPEQSQIVNGLLAVHDWLNPEHLPPGRARVHGGIHTLPYPLDKALRIAAAIGFARSPSLLKGLLKGLFR